MEEIKNMEKAADMVSAPALKKSAGKSERKNDNSKEAQVIRGFLESVGMYEADAIRVSIAIADGKTSMRFTTTSTSVQVAMPSVLLIPT